MKRCWALVVNGSTTSTYASISAAKRRAQSIANATGRDVRIEFRGSRAYTTTIRPEGWAVVLGGQVVEYARKAGSAKRRALELSRVTGKQAVIRCLDVGWHPAGEWVIRESEEGG